MVVAALATSPPGGDRASDTHLGAAPSCVHLPALSVQPHLTQPGDSTHLQRISLRAEIGTGGAGSDYPGLAPNTTRFFLPRGRALPREARPRSATAGTTDPHLPLTRHPCRPRFSLSPAAARDSADVGGGRGVPGTVHPGARTPPRMQGREGGGVPGRPLGPRPARASPGPGVAGGTHRGAGGSPGPPRPGGLPRGAALLRASVPRCGKWGHRRPRAGPRRGLH